MRGAGIVAALGAVALLSACAGRNSYLDSGYVMTGGSGYKGAAPIAPATGTPALPAAPAPMKAPKPAPGKLPLPVQYPLMPGDAALWPTLTLAQQQRALVFLRNGGTIRSSLEANR